MNYSNSLSLNMCVAVQWALFKRNSKNFIIIILKKLSWYYNYCIGSDSYASKGYVTSADICNSCSQNKYECVCSMCYYFKLLSSLYALVERAAWKYYLLCLLQNSIHWEYNSYIYRMREYLHSIQGHHSMRKKKNNKVIKMNIQKSFYKVFCWFQFFHTVSYHQIS